MTLSGVDGLSFAGCILETFAYGLSIPLFIKSAVVLHYEKNGLSPKMRNIMSMSTLLLFICITTHWILNFLRMFDAFIVYKNAIQYLSMVLEPKQEAATAFFVFSAMVVNGFLTYRTYLVWESDSIVCIAPFLGIVGTFAGGVGNIYGRVINANADPSYIMTMSPYIICGIISTFFTNLWCSALISYRIWNGFSAMKIANLGQWSTQRNTSLQNRFLHTFIESGMLLVIMSLISLVTYICQTTAIILVDCLMSPLIGISFALIIIRVGDAASTSQEEKKRPPPLSFISPREPGLSIRTGLSPGLRTYRESTSSFGDHEIRSGKVDSAC